MNKEQAVYEMLQQAGEQRSLEEIKQSPRYWETDGKKEVSVYYFLTQKRYLDWDKICDSFLNQNFTKEQMQAERLKNNGFQKAITEKKTIDYTANDKPSNMPQTIKGIFLEADNGKKYTILSISEKDNADQYTRPRLFLLDDEDFISGSEENLFHDKFWK